MKKLDIEPKLIDLGDQGTDEKGIDLKSKTISFFENDNNSIKKDI